MSSNAVLGAVLKSVFLLLKVICIGRQHEIAVLVKAESGACWAECNVVYIETYSALVQIHPQLKHILTILTTRL